MQDPRICPRCQQPNVCAIAASGTSKAETCWCMSVEPSGIAAAAGTSCYCSRCLQEIREEALRQKNPK